MSLIDTHAHLSDPRLRGQLPAIIDRARAAGVDRVICIATTADDSDDSLKIAQEFAGVIFPSVGIHPNHAAEAKPGDWDRVVALAESPNVVALGETGVDRHWDFTPIDMQMDYFARHLEISRRTNLPVVIHCREAEADMLRILDDDYSRHGPIRGVLHSFCGAWATAERAMQMGLYVSFAGMLTYKKADDVRDVALQIPEDRLLVETDCPYLAPEPVRGKTNEPANVAHTAAFLAQLRGMSADRLASLTSANAHKLFFSNK